MRFLIQGSWLTREQATDLLRTKYGWQRASIDAALASMARMPGMTEAL